VRNAAADFSDAAMTNGGGPGCDDAPLCCACFCKGTFGDAPEKGMSDA
jgi:hypothetical protein